MFKDESAELVYACHVLEYFDRVEVVDVLREWHRVLAHGGVVRLAVPDFAALAEVYRRGRGPPRAPRAPLARHPGAPRWGPPGAFPPPPFEFPSPPAVFPRGCAPT